MALPSEFKDAKNILSDRLLRPRKLSGVHGVGVGRAAPNVYHLRIYTTDLTAPGLAQELSRALRLNGPAAPVLPGPAMPRSFTLGSFFASQFPGKPWLKDIVVDMVQAPRAKFAGVSSAMPDDPEFPRSKPCRYMDPLNPLPAGVSVWRNGSDNVGTIGFFCKDSESPPKKYLVTCNHVLVPGSSGSSTTAGSSSTQSTSSIGVKVCRHGTSGPAHIANLHQFVPLTSIAPTTFPNTDWSPSLINRVDVAVAKMVTYMNLDNVTKMKVSPWVVGPYKMTGTLAPDFGMKVTKHGYASCTTNGEIDDILCDFAVLNDATPQREFLFVDQFRIVRFDEARTKIIKFAKEGDSGSLIYTVKSVNPDVNKSVGMLFAVGNKFASLGSMNSNSNSGDIEYTLATPIAAILKELNDRIMPVKLSLLP